jgi:hypothetical protein
MSEEHGSGVELTAQEMIEGLMTPEPEDGEREIVGVITDSDEKKAFMEWLVQFACGQGEQQS